MRKPSPETENRTLRRELKQEKTKHAQCRGRNALLQSLLEARGKEVEEWKGRFDALLRRDSQNGGGDGNG